MFAVSATTPTASVAAEHAEISDTDMLVAEAEAALRPGNVGSLAKA